MKNILVTGATSGFGRAIALAFIKANYFVVGLGRRKERLEELEKAYPAQFKPLCLDLQDKKTLEAGIQSILQEKPIHLLVNNAGLALGLDKAFCAHLDDWESMIETNIKGLVHITRLVLPSMVERNEGHIINMGSIAGTYPYPGGNIYGATKAFVKQFCLNLRADLADTKIRVSNVEPGLCGGTEFSHVRFKGDVQKVEELYAHVPYVSPEDIANVVLWIFEQPPHVNINRIEVMPVAQTFSPLYVSKTLEDWALAEFKPAELSA